MSVAWLRANEHCFTTKAKRFDRTWSDVPPPPTRRRVPWFEPHHRDLFDEIPPPTANAAPVAKETMERASFRKPLRLRGGARNSQISRMIFGDAEEASARGPQSTKSWTPSWRRGLPNMRDLRRGCARLGEVVRGCWNRFAVHGACTKPPFGERPMYQAPRVI